MPRILKWLALSFAAVVGLAIVTVAVSLLSPPPALVISKQTTVITGPLTLDGTPDYEAYLLSRGREGVTPENNAAVLLVQALWPAEIAPADQPAVLEALGITETPSEADALTRLDDPGLLEQLAESITGDSIDTILAEELVDMAQERPWTAEQVPALAEWVAANKRPLELIIEATKRPRYWFPSPTFLNDRHDLLIETLLPLVQESRSATRWLSLRSMHHLGEGRFEAAWRDAVANYQLAQQTSTGWCLVQHLVAIAMEGVASSQTVAILSHPDLPPNVARQAMSDLVSLPPLPTMSLVINEGERLTYAESLVAMAAGRHSELDLGKAVHNVDWNVPLEEGNAVFDKLVDLAATSDLALRRKKLDAFEAEMDASSVRVSEIARLAAAFFSRKERSQRISDIWVSLMTPALEVAVQAEDRQKTLRQLTITAAALGVYRAEQGAYPESLAELVPGVLDEVPIDLFSEQPFVYQRKPDGGYLLYSVGPNGRDDGGDCYLNEIAGGDWVADPVEHFVAKEDGDIVIRVPLPPMPVPPAADLESGFE
ncbi:MAG: hypothetical protein AAF589_08065 [Planctomycetota bacterium]